MLLVFLVGCSTKYIEFNDSSFSAQYPDWIKVSGNDAVNVQKGPCKVDIGIHAPKFEPSALKLAVDTSIIPELKRIGLHIENYNLNGNEAILELTANNVYGKQKYLACNGKLYKASAACNKKSEVINAVINSAKCS